MAVKVLDWNDKLKAGEPCDPRDTAQHYYKVDSSLEFEPDKILFDHFDDDTLSNAALKQFKKRYGDPVAAEGSLWLFDGSTWIEVTDGCMTRCVRSLAESNERKGESVKRIKLTKGNIKAAGRLIWAVDGVDLPEYFEQAPFGVQTRDHFISTDGTVMPADRGHRQRVKVDVDYDPQAKCPRFLEAFGEWFKDLPDAEDRQTVLRQWTRHALMGEATRYQRAIMLQGLAGSGKSTFLEIVQALFPSTSVSHVEPQNLSEPQQIATLVGARLNIVGDIAYGSIPSGGIKMVIDGTRMNCKRMRENVFAFRPRAAVAYSCNRYPNTSDSTRGFWRRWICVRFPWVVKTIDFELADHIIKHELPGVLNWALTAPKVEDGYTIPPSHHVQLRKWQGQTDVIVGWMDDCTQPTDDVEYGTKLNQAWDSYIQWCRDSGIRKTMSRGHFKEAVIEKIGEYKRTAGRDAWLFELTQSSRVGRSGHAGGW